MNINDIGLKTLSWVKKIKGDNVNLDHINIETTPTMDHEQWTTLLRAHVTNDGKVNYKGIKNESGLLQEYLKALSSHVPGKNWTKNEQLVYWINAYNAFTVKLIIDNYPLKSIKDISNGLPMIDSPWDIKFFKIGEREMDLNTIEHEILRKMFSEPRIHFAINCASFSCPKLRNEAFEADKIETQLQDQAIDFLTNPDKNLINESATQLSKIFDWFKSDFEKQGTLLAYIEQYNNKLNTANNIQHLKYSWALNDVDH